MYLGSKTRELSDGLLDPASLLLDGVHGDCTSFVVGGACVAYDCSRKNV